MQFCGKVLNCVDVGGESSALVAAGGSDPILRVWDPRKPGLFSTVLLLLCLSVCLSVTNTYTCVFVSMHARICTWKNMNLFLLFLGTSAPVLQFSSHTSWISDCKWHDKSWFHLLSSSYDGKVMLWDIRTLVLLPFPFSFFEYNLCRPAPPRISVLWILDDSLFHSLCFFFAVAFVCHWYAQGQSMFSSSECFCCSYAD